MMIHALQFGLGNELVGLEHERGHAARCNAERERDRQMMFPAEVDRGASIAAHTSTHGRQSVTIVRYTVHFQNIQESAKDALAKGRARVEVCYKCDGCKFPSEISPTKTNHPQ
ncbi:hypothetical protein J6590_041923 [Homalodisca vitripennis]|nr:hypothetical protein J6590_041923 [Homalodisca vitripennis]